MHLSYSTSSYKGQQYKSYSLAESYREGNTVRKRIVWPIGKLTDQQAEQIKLILSVVQGGDDAVTRIRDLVVQDTKSYLDIALVNALWDQWELDKAFDFEVTSGSLPTHTVAKILTINRCTDPCAHYSIPAWATRTALGEVLGLDLSGLQEDKLYYELDKIDRNQISIENHLFRQTYQQAPRSFDFINYDLTTTYFVGFRCSLSAFGKGKIECHGRRQVLLGVLINDDGYPFKWDVFPGNTAEVKTLKRNLNACKTRFALGQKNVTLVFDRGIISEENAVLIEEAQLKYISALDRNQIPGCGVSLEPFQGLKADHPSPPEGFKLYDEQLYFQDAGVLGAWRYILGFNPILFAEDRRNRQEKMAYFQAYLRQANQDLKQAQRDREVEATKSRIINELKRLRIQKYFDSPLLEPLTVQRRLKNGTAKTVNSFQVQIKARKDIVQADALLDGVCVFLTNHTEKQGRGFKVKPETIVQAYRNKTKIEDVFKNVKSFLKLRPFFVNTAGHVRAVYTICILAYFINRYLANQRKQIEEKDFLNSRELYAPFKDIDLVTLKDEHTGRIVKKAVQIPQPTQRLLEKIGMSYIVRSQ
jgi:transposase